MKSKFQIGDLVQWVNVPEANRFGVVIEIGDGDPAPSIRAANSHWAMVQWAGLGKPSKVYDCQSHWNGVVLAKRKK